jgi:hypothetical protein
MSNPFFGKEHAVVSSNFLAGICKIRFELIFILNLVHKQISPCHYHKASSPLQLLF